MSAFPMEECTPQPEWLPQTSMSQASLMTPAAASHPKLPTTPRLDRARLRRTTSTAPVTGSLFTCPKQLFRSPPVSLLSERGASSTSISSSSDDTMRSSDQRVQSAIPSSSLTKRKRSAGTTPPMTPPGTPPSDPEPFECDLRSASDCIPLPDADTFVVFNM